MAESALSLTYVEIAQSVARSIGYPQASADWTDDEQADIHRALDVGYRAFLNGHDWNFLRKFATLDTVADTYSYALPDDFGSIHTGFTFEAGIGRAPIKIVGESAIRSLQAKEERSGYPEYAAVLAGTSTGLSGQRFGLTMYPTPDAAYTLGYTYNILASTALRASSPYPLGGMAMADAVQACCLEAARHLYEDIPFETYRERIRLIVEEAKKHDVRLAPQILGENRDNSDGVSLIWRHDGESTVTVNGVIPD